MKLSELTRVRLLGRGGMAEAWLVVRRGDGGFEQQLCIKEILPAYAGDPDFVQGFIEEARIYGRLQHQNIVQMVDFGSGKEHFMALEFIDGCNLRELIRGSARLRKRLPAGLVTFIAEEMGRALVYAHDLGVIHRDISPGNIMLSIAGEVKLADFGIAKAHGRSIQTRPGHVKGKMSYMAPEYARAAKASAVSDLFALGVTLYEALSYRSPYRKKGQSAAETLSRAEDGDFVPLSELCDAPASLCRLVESCIAPQIAERPQHGREFLQRLARTSSPPTARAILGRYVVDARRALIDKDEESSSSSSDKETRPSRTPPRRAERSASSGVQGSVLSENEKSDEPIAFAATEISNTLETAHPETTHPDSARVDSAHPGTDVSAQKASPGGAKMQSGSEFYLDDEDATALSAQGGVESSSRGTDLASEEALLNTTTTAPVESEPSIVVSTDAPFATGNSEHASLEETAGSEPSESVSMPVAYTQEKTAFLEGTNLAPVAGPAPVVPSGPDEETRTAIAQAAFVSPPKASTVTPKVDTALTGDTNQAASTRDFRSPGQTEPRISVPALIAAAVIFIAIGFALSFLI